MKCTNCGAEIMDGMQNCPNCGSTIAYANQNFGGQQEYNGYAEAENTEDASLLIKILCLLFPLVGLILYFVWKSSAPVKAKSCIMFAGIGFVVNIVFALL